MLPRASSLEGSSTATGRLSRISRSACSAKASPCGLPSLLVKPSIAWVIASMPVAAAIFGGSVAVASGSRIARRGKSGKSPTRTLIFCSGSRITAPNETSEPVPAVVGMQASGATGSGAPMPSLPRGSVYRPS